MTERQSSTEGFKLACIVIIIGRLLKLLMKRLTAEQLRKLIPVFEQQTYKASQDKKEYIHDLILVVMHKRKLNHSMLCMNELIDIITQLEIPLKTHQMNELYLYSTYQRFENLSDTKKKILAILNQQKKKVDVKSVAEWLYQKIEKKEIIISDQKQRRVMSLNPQKKIEKKSEKLPSLIGTSSEKLQQQLRYLVQIFEQMEQARQNSGLIPIKDENQDNQVQVPFANIPYDPQLYDLNNNLCKLRIRAEERLSRIIELARDDPRIRKRLQEAIQRFQKARIEANQKIGRFGAIKARKRLQQKKQRQLKKYKELELGQNENLVHATHLFKLLFLPEIKSNKLVV